MLADANIIPWSTVCFMDPRSRLIKVFRWSTMIDMGAWSPGNVGGLNLIPKWKENYSR